jgi:NOL1/NOP2/fmu family ribosome biogenesis protein
MIFMENYLKERFGIVLDPRVKIGNPGVERFNLYSKSLDGFNAEREETRGILAGKKNGAFKPTSDLLQCYGWMATRTVVFLEKEDAGAFCAGKDIERINSQFCSRGYVAVSFKGAVLGCGFFDGEKLLNKVPLHKQVINRE